LRVNGERTVYVPPFARARRTGHGGHRHAQRRRRFPAGMTKEIGMCRGLNRLRKESVFVGEWTEGIPQGLKPTLIPWTLLPRLKPWLT
jgi:hypothetical protein